MRGHILTALLSFAIAALPMAPVAHAHLAQGTDGHSHVVAHTHGEAHHRHVATAGNHDHAAIDHDDSVLIAFNPVLAAPCKHVVVTPALCQASMIDATPFIDRGYAAGFVERLIHGPPRALSDARGPPVLSLL